MKNEDTWIILCIREDSVFPIVNEEDYPLVMPYERAREMVWEIMLCKASENLLVNIATGDTEWH